MDKSSGTNLHLWRFFTRAEESRANSSTVVQPPIPPPPPPVQCWTRLHAISPEFQHCIGVGGGGMQRILKWIRELFGSKCFPH